MTAHSIISRFNHLDGNPVKLETLRDFHNQVQKQLDAESHGPHSAQLTEIRQRLAKALKRMGKAGVNYIEKLTVTKITFEPSVKSKGSLLKPVKIPLVTLPNECDPELLEGLECNPSEAEPVQGLGFTQDGQKKIYDMVTNMILETMTKDGLFWREPWAGGGKKSTKVKVNVMGPLPVNFVSKAPYSGVNYWVLKYVAPHKKGYTVLNYVTINQVNQLGGKIRKGATAWPVIYYTLVYRHNGKNITEDQYEALSDEERNNAVKLPVVQYYNVFNAQDVEGVPGIMEPVQARKTVLQYEVEPIKAGEAIVNGMPKKPHVTQSKQRKAYYSPGGDYVHMPYIGVFDNEQEYYSTFYHELVHSTGHESRLKRELSQEKKKYAFEELIAELGASYLCAESGILYFTLNNSAAYLKGWSKSLREEMEADSKFFMKAAAKAQKASDFILDRIEKKVVEESPKSKREKKTSRPPVKRAERSKATAEHFTTLAGFTAADEVPAESADTFTLPGPMGQVLNQLQPYKLEIVISGEPSSSKSELMKQLADAFCTHGTPLGWQVGYLDYEHGGMKSKDTQAGMNRNVSAENRKLIQVGDPARNLDAVKALAKNFKVIVIDSGTKLGLKTNEWIDELREQYPDNIWVIGMQQNAAGGTRGGSAAEFDSPIVIKTNRPDKTDPLQNYAVVEKNRNNPTGIEYNIASKKIIEKIIDTPKEEKP
jgi:antirestriction protein ArdC